MDEFSQENNLQQGRCVSSVVLVLEGYAPDFAKPTSRLHLHAHWHAVASGLHKGPP